MSLPRSFRVASFFAVAVLVGACDGGPSKTTELSTIGGDSTSRGGSGGGTRPDTARPLPDTIRPLPAAVQVQGRVLGVSAERPVAGSSDTLRYEPIAGATLRIYQNVVRGDERDRVLIAETASGREGEFAFRAIPGGYYILESSPPTGSPYANGFEYLAANVPEVRKNIYLWQK